MRSKGLRVLHTPHQRTIVFALSRSFHALNSEPELLSGVSVLSSSQRGGIYKCDAEDHVHEVYGGSNRTALGLGPVRHPRRL